MNLKLTPTRTRPITRDSSSVKLAAALSIALLAGNPAHAGSEPSDSAASWGDFDGDGLEDLYLVNPAGPDRLFRNTGDGDFQDVTALSGLEGNAGTRRASWRDYDGDGRLDLLLVQEAGTMQLYRGQREGGFADETRAAGLADLGQARAASWVDYDRDGRLDLRVETEGGELVLMHGLASGFERREFALPRAEDSGAARVPVVSGTEASEGAEPRGATPGERVARDESDATSATPGTPGVAGRTPAGAWNASASPAPSTPFGEARGGSLPAAVGVPCTKAVDDFSNPGTCLPASSTPMLGMLYPLGQELFIDNTTGYVGIGTTSPLIPLHVSTAHHFTSLFESSSSIGTWLNLRNTDPASRDWSLISTASANGEGPGKLLVQAPPGGTHMVFDGTGRVGIGTATPGARLDVNGQGDIGVRSLLTSTTGNPIAMYSSSAAPGGHAVLGVNFATSGQAIGILGDTLSTSGFGVAGIAAPTTGTGTGVAGQSCSPTGLGVWSIGDFAATGTKAFMQPHPTDPARQIRFVCLEGNESGTYFRGSASLSDGRSVIEVPEEFRLVSEEAGLTVQLTARGPAMVWVESVDLERIVIRGSADIELDYFVNGVRRGFADFEPLEDNIGFVPKVRGVPFGTQYPAALRQILVESGVLNADFTPNEATATRLGWELEDAGEGAGLLLGAPAPAASAPAAPMQVTDSMALER